MEVIQYKCFGGAHPSPDLNLENLQRDLKIKVMARRLSRLKDWKLTTNDKLGKYQRKHVKSCSAPI